MNTTSNSSRHRSLFVDLAIGSSAVNNILGLPLNVYVMWLILAGARETLASDFFFLNLAMSEIVFVLFCLCYYVYVQFDYFGLKLLMFSLGLVFTARPLFLCCICVEYYVAVVHPMLYLGFKPLRYKVACCCVVWVNALVSCIYSVYTYENTLYLYGVFIQNCIFFSVKLFCCCSVLRALKRPGPGEKDREKKKKSNAMKARAFKIILLILSSLAINFCLYMAVIPLQCCMTTNEFAIAFTISTSLALATGFLQPLLYLHRAGKLFCFRELQLSLSTCVCL